MSSDPSDSELTDWQYDTDDTKGGPDEECYTKTVDDIQTVWCDSPEIIAQQCNDFVSSCCCRAPCSPSMCSGKNESVPCSYFDLSNSLGYCNLTLDVLPVYYNCGGNCTPRSQCDNYDPDGMCLDDNAETEGLCLLYEVGESVEQRCQLTCTMNFCNDSHMCVPMYKSSGEYSGFGACHPIE